MIFFFHMHVGLTGSKEKDTIGIGSEKVEVKSFPRCWGIFRASPAQTLPHSPSLFLATAQETEPPAF